MATGRDGLPQPKAPSTHCPSSLPKAGSEQRPSKQSRQVVAGRRDFTCLSSIFMFEFWGIL